MLFIYEGKQGTNKVILGCESYNSSDVLSGVIFEILDGRDGVKTERLDSGYHALTCEDDYIDGLVLSLIKKNV